MQSEHTLFGFSMTLFQRLLCFFSRHTRVFLASALFFSPAVHYAFPNVAKLQKDADLSIHLFYKDHLNYPQNTFPERIILIGLQFLTQPYELGALGEGEKGYFDQYPLYRLDAFDCETFVETVMALALAKDLTNFHHTLKQIRYHLGHISFTDRNHFTCIDWNPNNQQAGFIRDITANVLAQSKLGKPAIAKALINKPNWYQHVAEKRVRLSHATKKEVQKRITLLEQKGSMLKGAEASVPYIPFNVLFDTNGKPNKTLFANFPHGAILELVHSDWDLTSKIGTYLIVSHMGFVMRENNRLYFLQASSLSHQISKTPLIEYLQKAKKTSSSMVGINLQEIKPLDS